MWGSNYNFVDYRSLLQTINKTRKLINIRISLSDSDVYYIIAFNRTKLTC